MRGDVTVRLTKGEHDALMELAAEIGESAALIVRRAVRSYLESKRKEVHEVLPTTGQASGPPGRKITLVVTMSFDADDRDAVKVDAKVLPDGVVLSFTELATLNGAWKELLDRINARQQN